MKTITSKTPCPNCGGHEWYLYICCDGELCEPVMRINCSVTLIDEQHFLDCPDKNRQHVDECVTCGAVVS